MKAVFTVSPSAPTANRSSPPVRTGRCASGMPPTGRTVGILRGHEGSVYSVASSPDGKRTVSGGDDMAVRIWDTATGRQIQALTGHEDAVNSVTFSHDGKRDRLRQ
ncbi:MAG: hypothetical protein MZV70_34845 [Desulfobacterales bacterium]|nr:hypothetical protein [Desulfobacterales bacterium]